MRRPGRHRPRGGSALRGTRHDPVKLRSRLHDPHLSGRPSGVGADRDRRMGRDGWQSARRAGHHRQGEAQEKDVATESHGDTTKRGRTFGTSALIKRDTLAPCQDRTFCHVVARRDESEHERRRRHPLRRGHCPPEPSELLHDAVARRFERGSRTPLDDDPPPHPALSRRRRAPVPRARPSAGRSTVDTSAAGVGRTGSREGARRSSNPAPGTCCSLEKEMRPHGAAVFRLFLASARVPYDQEPSPSHSPGSELCVRAGA